MSFRRAAAVDANQKEIVQALRRAGCTVQVLSAVGQGCPDILVGHHGVNYVLEIKDGAKVLSKQALTPVQEEWHATWAGQKAIVKTVEQALFAVGLLKAA